MGTSPPNILIGYEQAHSDVADQLLQKLNSMAPPSISSSQIERPTGKIQRDSIKSKLNKCNVLIVFISLNAIESPWIRSLYSLGLDKLWDRKADFHIIPVTRDSPPDAQLPLTVRMMDPTDGSGGLLESIASKAIGLACKFQSLPIPDGILDPNYDNWQKWVFNDTKDQIFDGLISEMQNQFHNQEKLFKKQMDNIRSKFIGVINSIAAKEHILSPISIKFREESANQHIWVLTRYLYNDLYNDEIKEGVYKNLKNGKTYLYFIPENDPLAYARKRKFLKALKSQEDSLGENEKRDTSSILDTIEFIRISKDTFFPFEELVIYDPFEAPRTWGYVQYSFQDSKMQHENLYLKLDKSLLTDLVTRLLDSHPQIKNFSFKHNSIPSEEQGFLEKKSTK